jgi:hypothetical protein
MTGGVRAQVLEAAFPCDRFFERLFFTTPSYRMLFSSRTHFAFPKISRAASSVASEKL